MGFLNLNVDQSSVGTKWDTFDDDTEAPASVVQRLFGLLGTGNICRLGRKR
ncbi:hypothetical protein SAMN04487958_107135 [Vreelandella subterranea]|uniref:Uncharacterized protein n=1 Tax=Vreelandella subterranea TaxID=416874 RepID=A0A1H9UPC8_9GAMM|nr:hypothetical protein SAMN04487958_107135 [Halomonas subterranea]